MATPLQTEMPRWLAQRAIDEYEAGQKAMGQLASVIGRGLGGGVSAMAQGKKFSEGAAASETGQTAGTAKPMSAGSRFMAGMGMGISGITPLQLTQFHAQLAETQAQTASAQSLAQQRIAVANAERNDSPQVTSFLNALANDPNTPIPHFELPRNNQMAIQARQRAQVNALQQQNSRTAFAAAKNFSDQVAELGKLGGDTSGFMPTLLGKQPITSDLVQALGIGLQAARQHNQNQADMARLEALQRGDVRKTTISGGKVTETYQSGPSSADRTTVPVEMAIAGRKVIVNPKTGAYKFADTGTKTPSISLSQLHSEYTRLETAINNPRATKDQQDELRLRQHVISDYASKEYPQSSILFGVQAPATSPSASAGGQKIGRFTVTPAE